MYITNQGETKTMVYNNNQLMDEKDLKWNAKYDGKIADLDVNINNNGEKKKIIMEFDNEDLAEILNIPSVGEDLMKRIKNDYMRPRKNNNYPMVTLKQPDIHDFHNKLMNKYSPVTKNNFPITKSSYYKKYSKKYTVRKHNFLNNYKKNKKSKIKSKTVRNKIF